MGSTVGGLGTAGLPADKALAGVPRLLDDLQRLFEDTDSADVIFILGREEERVFAHRVILIARCKSFQNCKRGEICRIPGCSVQSAPPGTPIPIRLPQAPVETFKQFLLYVYTGKILLQDSSVFEMLALAQELGVDELRNACEDHVTSTLSVASACTFLATAMDIYDRTPGGKAAAGFVERCVSFIGENAAECVKTNSFLSLSKDAVIKLISSDYLYLEEEDVWRAVLNWAKYQAGVTQPTAHWTEEERVRVCQHLATVIGHVRLLLIDSQVFAEEVEPTGAVPMELSLERYRHAALPSKYLETSEDQRLRPRISPHLFPNSHIIGHDKSHFQRILNAWYGNSKQSWRLLYRASCHGFSAAAFHRHCDGITPLYVIVLGTRGEICGGFSDVAFKRPQGKNHYLASDKAFLFTIYNHQNVPPTQFHIVKKTFAICYNPESGPVFGAGADLFISSNCNTNIDSYSNLPHTYDGDAASAAVLMGEYHFAVADYEVFTIGAAGVKHLKSDRY